LAAPSSLSALRPPGQPRSETLQAGVRGAGAIPRDAGDLIGKPYALAAYGRGDRGALGDLVDHEPQRIALEQPGYDKVKQATVDRPRHGHVKERAVQNAADEALDIGSVNRPRDEPARLGAVDRLTEPVQRIIYDGAISDPGHDLMGQWRFEHITGSQQRSVDAKKHRASRRLGQHTLRPSDGQTGQPTPGTEGRGAERG
jgi:hypothetical protein